MFNFNMTTYVVFHKVEHIRILRISIKFFRTICIIFSGYFNEMVRFRPFTYITSMIDFYNTLVRVPIMCNC